MKSAIVMLVVLSACAATNGGDAETSEKTQPVTEPIPSIIYASPRLGPQRACDAICPFGFSLFERARIQDNDECGTHVIPGDGGTWRDGCRVYVEVPDDVTGRDVCDVVMEGLGIR